MDVQKLRLMGDKFDGGKDYSYFRKNFNRSLMIESYNKKYCKEVTPEEIVNHFFKENLRSAKTLNIRQDNRRLLAKSKFAKDKTMTYTR